jgi:hypothetical protein
MPSAFKNTLRESILDVLLGNAAMMALPSDWTAALYLGDPLGAGTEMTGTNYAAVSILAADWTPASAGKRNAVTVRWPATGFVGAGGWSLGTAGQLHLALRDGTDPPLIALLASLQYLSGYTVPPGETVECPAGTIVIDWVVLPDSQTFGLSAAFRQMFLDHIFGGAALTIPANWELALWRGSPFAGGTEVTDPEYARLTRPNDNTEWSAASGGKANLTAVRWPATGSPVRQWGTVTHLCLCLPGSDTASVALTLSWPLAMGPGNPLDLAIGAISADWL